MERVLSAIIEPHGKRPERLSLDNLFESPSIHLSNVTLMPGERQRPNRPSGCERMGSEKRIRFYTELLRLCLCSACCRIRGTKGLALAARPCEFVSAHRKMIDRMPEAHTKEEKSEFDSALETVEQLPLEAQDELLRVLQRRLSESRRAALAQDIQAAREAYRRGETHSGSVADLMNELTGA